MAEAQCHLRAISAPRQEFLADAAVALEPAAPAVDFAPRPILASLWPFAAFDDGLSFRRRQDTFENDGEHNSYYKFASCHIGCTPFRVTSRMSGERKLLACSVTNRKSRAAGAGAYLLGYDNEMATSWPAELARGSASPARFPDASAAGPGPVRSTGGVNKPPQRIVSSLMRLTPPGGRPTGVFLHFGNDSV